VSRGALRRAARRPRHAARPQGRRCRLAAKPSKRDLAASTAYILEREHAFTMNTSPDLHLPGQRVLADFTHLRLSTTELSPSQAADRILAW
jgi:hypothetical protein